MPACAQRDKSTLQAAASRQKATAERLEAAQQQVAEWRLAAEVGGAPCRGPVGSGCWELGAGCWRKPLISFISLTSLISLIRGRTGRALELLSC